MKAERLKILQLLEDGTITAEEAAKLLEVIKGSVFEEENECRHSHFWDEETQKNWDEKVAKFSQNIESFSKEVGSRLDAVFKELEPKLRAASKTVVEKTAAVIDEISKSLNETLQNMDKCEKSCNCGCEEGSNCTCNTNEKAEESSKDDPSREN